MAFKHFALLACVCSVALAQQQGARSNIFNFDIIDEEVTTPRPPIPILRYVDTQNPDGSYTYGYESADGTYKIETRYATGEVKGKYGYYDDVGTYREIEYGATPTQGFMPRGEGLVVAPPAAPAAPAPIAAPVAAPKEEEPLLIPTPKPASGRRVTVRRRRPSQRKQQTSERNSQFEHFSGDRASLPSQRRRPVGEPTPVLRRRPIARPATTTQRPAAFVQQRLPEQPRFTPVQPVQQTVDFNAFAGHPAQNIDLSTGSFNVFYSG